jgi:tRNA 2-selenouridine synthase
VQITDDFESLILNNTPLIDTRAPIEFAKGSFEGAVNLPLLNDKEREIIGTCYKKSGNSEAVKLGHKLISGEVKEQRVNAWINFIKEHPNAVIFCFRGGQRSTISQQWLYDANYPITKIKGGYKAFRNYILEQYEVINSTFTPIRVGGFTGSGKTILLNELENTIDLEGLANHRGSAFGRQIAPQPTQINFENNLLFRLKRAVASGHKTLIFEDESKNIGRVYMPNVLNEYLVKSKMVILQESIESRVEIILDEYVIKAQKEYSNITLWAEDILSSLERIKKRLGGLRYQGILKLFNSAYKLQQVSQNINDHKLWIKSLLVDYYDPMYSYQLEKNSNLIIFKGNKDEVKHYLKSL